MATTTDSEGSQVASWDLALLGTTAVDNSTILITFADSDRSFKVSRALLSHWSPVFRDMFASVRPHSTPASGDSVELQINAKEFQSFLWFIHVDPISFAEYESKCPISVKFQRAIDITTMAQFFIAESVIKWGLHYLLQHTKACATLELLPQLHKMAQTCFGICPELQKAVQERWCAIIVDTQDPVSTLLATRELDDHHLQAYSYFHILQKIRNGQISADLRLSALDKFRLLVGSLNLRMYKTPNCKCHPALQCNHELDYNLWGYRFDPKRPKQGVDLSMCSLDPGVLVQDKYDSISLWDIFTRSPMGLSLHDGVDLSQAATAEQPAPAAS